MNFLRRYSWIFAAVILAVGLTIYARREMRHFALERIFSRIPYHPEWECENPSDIDAILAQPYHFYINGGQSWVFLSADGKWILKFFDCRITWHDIAGWLHLPENFRPDLTPRQIRRREGPPAGYALAAKRFREECGLVGIYLNGKSSGVHQIKITNPIQCEHDIDLAKTSFVIQRKAETLPDRLVRLLKTKDTKEASKALSQALNLIAARSAVGIADGDDVKLHLNLGFVGDKPMYIDAGTFLDSPALLLLSNAEKEILRSADVLLAKLAEEDLR